MRYSALLPVIVFLWFAYLQLNDPDPVWWVVIYLIPAYISAMCFLKKSNIELLIVLAMLYGAYAINLWLQMTKWDGFFTQGLGMEMKTMNQELARESIGLMICVVTYLIIVVTSLFQKK